MTSQTINEELIEAHGLNVDMTISRYPGEFGGYYIAHGRLASDQNTPKRSTRKQFTEQELEMIAPFTMHWDASGDTPEAAETKLFALITLDMLKKELVQPYVSKRVDEGTYRTVFIKLYTSDKISEVITLLIGHLPAYGGIDNVVRLTKFNECEGVSFNSLRVGEEYERNFHAIALANIVYEMQLAEKSEMTAVHWMRSY